MFSFFNGGITVIYPKRHIDLPALVRLIKNNPDKSKIEKVRELRRHNKDYGPLKRSLSYITPNCLVKIRNLKESDYNLFTLSSYIYFDIDDYRNAEQLKERFIKDYGHMASLICFSCSKGGISILFKVSNCIKNENEFFIARQYIIDNIMVNEDYDKNTSDIARPLFISLDPEVFFNYENEIEIPEYYFKNKNLINKKCTTGVYKTPLTMVRSNCALLEDFNPTPIKEVLEQLIFETPVTLINSIVEFKEIEYVEIRYGYIIKDGFKHKTFTNIIHKLVYLNPNSERQILLSYLYYINQSNTGDTQMNEKELIRLFDFVYNGIKDRGRSNVKPKLKRVHYNKDLRSEIDKRKISGLIIGALKQNASKLKIEKAINEIESKGAKISNSSIAKQSGLNRGTIIKHRNTELIDLDKLIQELNHSI
ncbi:BT4734/BF3469 family protein [Aquirufa lenticrescens]|uniref:BT4734/BF3469 family protein n=1 Tax=Aquirufa lenticrescens TaxID=2696560 RepID=UPI001CAA4D51|nr:BT4734/BF3469 family protein [Aquirufa lenticrescens]UAJ13619.1 hypothetical protein G9X62_03275 [Aquirufa lenticrescens]